MLWEIKIRVSCGILPLHSSDHHYQIWATVIRSSSLIPTSNEVIILKPLYYFLMTTSLSLNTLRAFLCGFHLFLLHSDDNFPPVQLPWLSMETPCFFYACDFLLNQILIFFFIGKQCYYEKDTGFALRPCSGTTKQGNQLTCLSPCYLIYKREKVQHRGGHIINVSFPPFFVISSFHQNAE